MMRQVRLTGFVAAAVLLLLPAAARAQVWTEVGDASNSATGAQLIQASGFGTLTTINGVLGNNSPASSGDMDAYRFLITSPATFSATTVNAGTNAGADTMLWLFRGNGIGVALNDDTVGGTEFRSTLPAGNALYATLPAGEYILALSFWENRPTGPTGSVIWALDQEGDTVRPPLGPGAAEVFSGQDGLTDPGAVPAGTTFPPGMGYSIGLTGVAPVPEPGTLALCGGAVLAGFATYRRRKAA